VIKPNKKVVLNPSGLQKGEAETNIARYSLLNKIAIENVILFTRDITPSHTSVQVQQ
jgi:hypothetical protein